MGHAFSMVGRAVVEPARPLNIPGLMQGLDSACYDQARPPVLAQGGLAGLGSLDQEPLKVLLPLEVCTIYKYPRPAVLAL
jgi:hypothetical protein